MRMSETEAGLLRGLVRALCVLAALGVLFPTIPVPFCTTSPLLAYDHPQDDGHQRRSDPNEDEDDDEDEDDEDECNQTGSPVFLKTGQLRLHYVDLGINSRPPVQIERTYNSQDEHNGLMGFHWTHTFDVRVIPVTDGDTHDLLVRWPNGVVHRFVGQPDGSYSKPLSCPV